jgi:hypothetical protein
LHCIANLSTDSIRRTARDSRQPDGFLKCALARLVPHTCHVAPSFVPAAVRSTVRRKRLPPSLLLKDSCPLFRGMKTPVTTQSRACPSASVRKYLAAGDPPGASNRLVTSVSQSKSGTWYVSAFTSCGRVARIVSVSAARAQSVSRIDRVAS